MPDRIIRVGILTSESVNNLSYQAEVFYRRLMNVVDDYGRFDARPSILRASLYPLKLDRVTERNIEHWLGECQKGSLVTVYAVESRRYLELKKFDQRLRAKLSKWPPPPSSAVICQQMSSNAAETESETESETEKNIVGLSPDDTPISAKKLNGYYPDALEILNFLNNITGRNYRPVESTLKPIVARLKSGATVQDCKTVIAKKHGDWAKKDEMWPYLRPATLFNATKFEQYLGECVIEDPKKRITA